MKWKWKKYAQTQYWYQNKLSNLLDIYAIPREQVATGCYEFNASGPLFYPWHFAETWAQSPTESETETETLTGNAMKI